MKQEPKKNNSWTPVILIVAVMIVAIVGFAYLYSTSKPQPAANRAASNASPGSSPRNQTIPANAPPGAAPVYAIGPADAAVVIEEFADFQCPSCASAHPVMKELQSAFAGNKNVRFVFRHLPLGIHDKAYDAAVVAEAAGMQGVPKFWAMVDLLMANQQTWAAPNANARELWKGYAERIGLDVAKFENDAAGMGARGRIELDTTRARALGVSSTPSIYINNKLIPFADVNTPTMRRMIESEIETIKAASSNSNAAPAPAGQPANAAAANSNAGR